MLQAFDLSYSPDPRVGTLFEHIDLSLIAGDKVALVGRNGVGKSILMSILAGRRRPLSGRVVLSRGARVSLLEQDFDHQFQGTLGDLVDLKCPESEPYVVARTLHRLGLPPEFLAREYRSLSVGEKMRGSLAVLLAAEPDILLLDEPTNHLDVQAKEWLESFLVDCPEAVLLACHDRSVINAVANRVLEMERGCLTEYSGGYDSMSAAKRLRFEQQSEAWHRHKDEDRRLRLAAEDAAQRAITMTAKPTGRTYDPKAKAFYSGKEAKLDKRAKAIRSRVDKARSEALEKPFVDDTPALTFRCKPLRSAQALTARGISKRYDQKVLFTNLNLTIDRGSRVAITGPNGCGKTTLFRILMHEEAPDKGEVATYPGAQLACLSQERDLLNSDLPAIKALGVSRSEDVHFARTALARLGLRGEMADRPIGVLSVGERTKVEIVHLLLTGANVLFLDEPTNHLDLVSIQALESALADFPGAIVFTSHDREFVDRLATEVVKIG